MPAGTDRQPAAVTRHHALLTFSLISALFIIGLDAGVVNVILPELQTVFNTTVSRAMLLATVYLTAMAAFQLVFGRLADLFNPLSIFLAGVACFFAGSLGCVLSQSIDQIVAGRAIQGLGAAMLSASFGAIVLRLMPREKTGRIIGLMTMVMSLGSIIGPPLGGFLAEHLSWHWVFAINLPICVVAAIPLIIILRSQQADTQSRPAVTLARLDPPGALLSVLLFASLPLCFSQAARDGWSSGPVPILLAIFALSATLFVLQEQRARCPLLRLTVISDRRVQQVVLIKALTFIVINGVMLVFPFFLVKRLELPVSGAGVMMLACAVSMALLTPLSGRLTDRIGSKRVLLVGGLVLLATAILSVIGGPLLGRALTFFSLAAFGAAFAWLTIAGTVQLLKLAPPGEEGIFSGLNSLLMPVAGSLGLAIFSYLYATGTTPAENPADASLAGFRASMAGLVVCAGLLLVLIQRSFREH